MFVITKVSYSYRYIKGENITVMEHVFIYEKGKITVSGVVSLDGFDEKEARIKLENNAVIVKGTDFVLQEMAQNSGRVCFSGKISSVEYAAKAEKVPFIKRLFR